MIIKLNISFHHHTILGLRMLHDLASKKSQILIKLLNNSLLMNV